MNIRSITGLLTGSILAASCATATVGTQNLATETAPPSPAHTVEAELEELLFATPEIATETPNETSGGTTTQIPPGNQITGTPGTQAPTGQTPEAVQMAIANLSQMLNIPESQVQVTSFEQTEWPDSCLGLAAPGEMCLQVITPGWLILLDANGRQYEIHTDETGDRVRLRQGGLP